MRVEHLALWTPSEERLERLRAFYATYFGATAGARYASARRPGFVSYFLTFPAAGGAPGARLELMTAPGLAAAGRGAPAADVEAVEVVGYAHVALAVGDAAAVDALVARLRADGVAVEAGPRRTGDGYYEAVVRDPDGNLVEVMAEPIVDSAAAPGAAVGGPAGAAAGPVHRGVRVVPYAPGRAAHRVAYRALNLAWIARHFAVEDRDRRELDDPDGQILARGGHILVAEAVPESVAEADEPDAPGGGGGPEVLGVCALLAEPDGAFELAKMAVHEAARGRGVGRALGEAAVARARALGAPRVDLLSNTELAPAVALYRALGFVEVPLPATDYARANVKMVLDLARPARAGGSGAAA